MLDLSHDWWGSGGYYYLHKDIPLYFAYHESIGILDASNLRRSVSPIITRADEADIPGFAIEGSIWQRYTHEKCQCR